MFCRLYVGHGVPKMSSSSSSSCASPGHSKWLPSSVAERNRHSDEKRDGNSSGKHSSGIDWSRCWSWCWSRCWCWPLACCPGDLQLYVDRARTLSLAMRTSRETSSWFISSCVCRSTLCGSRLHAPLHQVLSTSACVRARVCFFFFHIFIFIFWQLIDVWYKKTSLTF